MSALLTIGSMLAPTLLSSIMGGKQLGQSAPAANLGGQGGLLGPVAPPVQSGPAPITDVINAASQAAVSGLGAPQSPLADYADKMPMSGLGAIKSLSESGLGGPLSGTLFDGGFGQDAYNLPGKTEGEGEKKPQGFGGFMGGLDKALQSPSHLLALGLLRQMGGNGILPLAGLLGMGYLNRKK